MHVIPHQIVWAQGREGGLQFQTTDDAALCHFAFTHAHHVFRQEVFDVARFGMVGHGSHQDGIVDALFTACFEHTQSGRQNQAADAKAQRIDAVLFADAGDGIDGTDDAALYISVPSEVFGFFQCFQEIC